jgi:flagellin-like hook-associated protein FlgL
MADISLNAGIRSNLLSLVNTQDLLARTQTRLGTGKKVNSAIDNPTNYFTSVALKNRSADLTARLDGIAKGIQTVKAADTAISGIKSLIGQLKGIVADAQGTSNTQDQLTLGSRFVEVRRQIDTLAKDAGYDGVNLLQGNSLTVQFSEKAGDATLGLQGFTANATSSDVGVYTNGAQFFTSSGELTTAIASLETAETNLRNQSRSLSANLGILTARQDFTKNLVNTLTTGADNLVNADINEESANLLALNTQQSLGVNALSLASQSAQSVLRLLQ